MDNAQNKTTTAMDLADALSYAAEIRAAGKGGWRGDVTASVQGDSIPHIACSLRCARAGSTVVRTLHDTSTPATDVVAAMRADIACRGRDTARRIRDERKAG